MLFGDIGDIVRVLTMGAASYVALVIILRLSGKRTLAKLNAFDLVVTVALGSILATSALSRDVAFADAVTAMAVLIGAQFVVAWFSVRSDAARDAVRSGPLLLVRNGSFVEDALRRSRISHSEVRQAIRSTGRGGLEAIAAVVLETDGTLSVIGHGDVGSGDALAELTDQLGPDDFRPEQR